MTDAVKRYQEWTNNSAFDIETRRELLAIADDQAEIEERFYQDLAFGTGGLRGILGAGTNRMNQYTVSRAALGFARNIVGRGDAAIHRGVVISYDSRHRSREFALQTALIFAGQGIRARLSDELRPVPMLSFAVRHFGAAGGVMITASHNPPKYNGFKAYGEDGGQLPPDDADIVIASMNAITDLAAIRWPDEAQARADGLLVDMGADLDQAYDDYLLTLSISGEAVRRHPDLEIVYTPLHGSGNKPVRRILGKLGFRRVMVVPEQEQPNGDFPTVRSPNPEERSAMAMAIDLADKEQADLVIGTDPDADRTGLCVRDREGNYQVLSGNQIGLLLTDYVLSARQRAGQLPAKSFVVTTIVSTRLMRPIAAHYGVDLYECLTGFKFIAELIQQHDEEGDGHFQFGFEESYGYLAGTEVRDKDAVVSSMLIAEMAAAARDRGLTLYDLLHELYARFGFAAEHTLSVVMEGKAGLSRIRGTMTDLRGRVEETPPGVPVCAVLDVLSGTRTELGNSKQTPLDLPESDVLLFELEGLDWFCVRPSGTEPKLKIYFGCYDADESQAAGRLAEYRQRVEAWIRAALERQP